MTKLHSIEPLEARIAPAVAVFELSQLNGSNGFTVIGEAERDQAGFSANDAGDVNGDGFDDLIIGAVGADPNGSYSGASYVVFGKAGGFAASIDLSTLNGSNGFKLSGATMDHMSGFSVSAAGDIDGDGFDDVLVGAPSADPNAPDAGATYVVFGKASGFSANLNLSTLDGTNGFRISGEDQDDHSGSSVSAAGDVNGDGFDDLIIGAASGNQSGGLHAGAIYVVFGNANGFAATLNLSTLNGSNGFKLSGVTTAYPSGLKVSGAGDINRDGFGDVIIGANLADPNGSNSGASYVVFGKADGFAANLDLAALDGTNGFTLSGVAAGDQFGSSVSGAGDVNGDGFDDVIVGAIRANTDAGASYVVFGKASGFAANFDAASLDGGNGFKLSGVSTESFSGTSVSAAGDFNGDNFGDLIIGTGSPTNYVVFGRASGFGADLNLSMLDGSNGFKLTRAGSTAFGTSVSTAGDVNRDGFDDLLIGSGLDGPSRAGQSYVIFGSALGPFATMRISDATVTEPLTGTATASFTVTLSTPNAQPVTVQYSTADGTATAPDDYAAASDLTLTFAPGETSKTLLIPIHGNAPAELDETFFVNLSNPTNATLDDAQGIGTIQDESATFQLSSLNGLNGFKLSGVAAGDSSGHSVSDAGDVNGDGFGDLIIGAFGADPHGSFSGESYVVFGKASGFATNLDLSTLDGTNGFKLNGVAADDRSGISVSGADDVNGDGFDDLIIGADGVEPNGSYSGASYVVFGKASGFSPDLDLSTLDGSNGFKLSGVAIGDRTGGSVSNAGDVNDDGFADLIIGAGDADPNGDDSGASYVVFGRADGFAANLNLSTLDGTNGFKLSGVAAYDRTGRSVSGAGDVNGDGFGDVIIGATGADLNGPYSGASYVVFGKASGFAADLNLSTLDGTNGFKLSGVAEDDFSGGSVSDAGDVNGDGFGDLIIGATGADPNANLSGASYVVFGKAGGFAANLNLSTLDGSNGFKLSGVGDEDRSGRSVSGAGDVNGDGFSDLIIGASRASPNGVYSGASYLVFGKASGFAPNLDLSALVGSNGFKIAGVAASDYSGYSVSDAGDVNGDGFGDVIIGAFGADPNGEYSGASYVVFGQAPQLPGVSIGDVAVLEGNAGSASILFPVTLSFAFPETVTVQFSTASGTATAGSDYTPRINQTLEFAPGETLKMIAITVFGDTGVEPNETYLINLSNATNASIADGQAQGTILNEDVVPVTFSSDGRRVTFPDVDGDLVTVTTTKSAFVQGNFVFGPVGQLSAIDLTASSNLAAFTGAKITAFAQTASGGDGLINVGKFNAVGVNLQKVTIDGDLGEIDVGTGGPGNVALQKLIANSMGISAGVAPATESTFAGRVGVLKIAHDVKAALNIKGGPGSTGIDVVGQIIIGGSLDGSAGGAAAGLLQASGGIGKVVVRESVIGGAEQSGIVAGGKLGVVKIGSDLRSADPARPVTISALGDPAATDVQQAVAFARLAVAGNVLNAEILAGYRRDGTPFNPDASISNIIVAGDWSASSVAAGVTDATGDGFGRNDTLIAGDTTPALFARIASITIAGTATGSSTANDHFGITAQQIGRVTAGNKTHAFTTGPDNVLLDPVHLDFRAVDFA